MKRKILLLIIGSILVIIPTVWILQKTPYLNRVAIKNIIRVIEQKCCIKVSIKSSSINLFTGTINLNDVEIKSRLTKNIFVKCKKWKLSTFKNNNFSFKNFGVTLEFYNLEIHTKDIFSTKKEVPLALYKTFTPSPNHPLKPSFVSIKNISIHNHNKENELSILKLPNILKLHKDKNNCWHGKLSLKNGSATHKQKTLLTQINGKITFHEYYFNQGIVIKTKASGKSPLLSNIQLFLNGIWTQKSKTEFILFNEKKTLNIRLTNNTLITGTFPLSIINSFLNNNPFKLKDKCFFNYENNELSIRFNKEKSFPAIEGKLSTATNKICLDLTNSETIDLLNNVIFIKQNDILLSININKNGNLNGKYQLGITHKETKRTKQFKGNFFFDKNKKKLKISGKSFYGSYLIEFNFLNQIPISKVLLRKNGKSLINLTAQPNDLNTISGYLHYSFLNIFLKKHIDKFVFDNNGKIDIQLTYDSDKRLHGKITNYTGNIYIIGNQNLIRNFSTSFDYNTTTRHLTIPNIQVLFQKGKISCHNAQLIFNKNFTPKFIQIPIQFYDLLVAIQDNFLGIIYGNLFIEKNIYDKKITANGNIILKKALFKENIFSNNLNTQYSLFQFDPLLPDQHSVECNINISNEYPLSAQTNVLQAQAQIDLLAHIIYKKHTPLSTQIIGSIEIEKGTFNFLSNKLFITSGKVSFIPNRLNDPIINLTAKNKIKKYIITLQVTGSAQNPTILLEANPELTEEQILGLLLAGSENSTLQSDLPAIVMQNLNNLITGRKKTLHKTMSFFKKVTKPLKYIQITPDFTDQSGRGGIKGSLLIDVSDRLHARIQKNLASQEDLSIEIEYAITDDIYIKAIKDQRGDLGAEVELRIKP